MYKSLPLHLIVCSSHCDYGHCLYHYLTQDRTSASTCQHESTSASCTFPCHLNSFKAGKTTRTPDGCAGWSLGRPQLYVTIATCSHSWVSNRILGSFFWSAKAETGATRKTKEKLETTGWC